VQRLTRERSVTGVHKSLMLLVEQGVVLRQRVSRTDHYRLNPDHVSADAIKAIARLPEKVYDLMRRELEAWDHKPAYAAVFGSTAGRE
jgi:predicted nucleotidyltransferase